MSQQLQITGGAKVRDLQDVIIGTSGVLSSLAFNVANGVPKLDVNGKILVSQLPNSVMEYQGTWNAATNTPTLVNGVGNQGDVYLCNVAGTTNFGAGPITFAVGDSAIYSGTIWQRAGGATGTVTSVGLSTSGNAFTIGSSPVTTSGTITINGSGTSGQYINGAGNLTTFPTLISSIGLSMPSAFNVSNSPLTANGTIAVTGAGYPSQYIRGDGTLADFPTSGGGGSSVSYYLNGGTSQGTIGGVTYYEMSKIADTGTGVDFPKTGDGLIVSFLTDAGDPAQLNIPAGNWNYEIYASMSSNGGTPQMYAELYVYNGTTFTLISTSSNEILYDGTNLNLYTFAMTVPATTLSLTDRLAVKIYATNSGGKTTTVHTQDSHLCQIITTFSTGITALNGLTAQVQYFATGTSGTDFNISSTTATHTFNIPDASATNRGLITTGTQTIAGIKTFNLSTKNETGIQLKNDIGIVPVVTGYTNLNGLSAGLAITNSAGVSNNLLVPSTTGYSYTFPAASGTIALTSSLASYVPYTGAIADVNLGLFSLTSNTIKVIGDNSTYGGTLSIKQNNVTSLIGTGYTELFGKTNRLGISFGAGSIALLSNSILTLERTYTLPDASGTIALTSNLSAYLPLAGGIMTGSILLNNNLTISGQLFGTSSYASMLAMSPSDKVLIDNSGRGVIFGGTIGNGTYTYTLPSATGTLALGTGTTNYHTKFTGTSTIGNSLIWDNGTNVGIGNTNTSYTLDVSGTGRFSGNMVLGTTALSGGGAAQWLTANGTAYGGGLISSVSGVTKAYYYYDSTGYALVQGASGVGVKLLANNVDALTIASTGAATFSSSVTAKSYTLNGTNGNSGQIIQQGDLLSTIATNFLIQSSTGNGIGFLTNGGTTFNMFINSSGNVLIGTTTDTGQKLQVNGTILAGSTGSNIRVSGSTDGGLFTSGSLMYLSDWNTATKGLYINLTSGVTTIQTLGTGTVTASSGTLSAISDMNLKISDGYIDNALDKILKLVPRYFYWKEETGLPTDIRQLGFYAQEVNAALGEEAANTPKKENDRWGIYDRGIIAMLTKAIQEMNTKLDAQNQTITSLQEQINELKNK